MAAMPKRRVPSEKLARHSVVARVRTLLFIVGLLAWSDPGRASTIALLRPSSTSPEVTEALFRLQGELLAVGLEVELRTPPPSFRSDPMETDAWFQGLATERSIDAVIDILGYPRPVGVDIWIYQNASQSFRVTRVLIEPRVRNAPETLAIRAIEVLRANFLVLDLPAREQAARPPTAEPPAAAAEPEPATAQGDFEVAAGAAVITSLHRVGPAIQPLVRFDWMLGWGLAAEATLSGFGTRPSVETQAGSVRVAQDYAHLGLRYLASSGSALGVFLTLAGGAMRTTLDGSAELPNRGHHLDHWAFVAEASLGARLRLFRRYHLSLGAHVQFAMPYAAIHFVDTQVATTGRPNLLASLVIGVWL